MDNSKSGTLYERFFTTEGVNPLEQVEWVRTTANAQGEQMEVSQAPKNWSPLAVDIAAGKYFKRSILINDGRGENSIKDLILRICDTVSDQGEIQGYFNAETKAIFRDELYHIVVNQLGSFNSPVWFNCGLKEKYGLEGSPSNKYCWDSKEKAPVKAKDDFTRPQLSACFIQSVEDDMEDIAAQVAREMRIFKGGSGSGTNFSTLRGKGESLSTGGTSSGVMSFLRIYDVAAASTKSGGTNRRAAKMVILNADHPEIMEFVTWKAREEKKAKALIAAGYSSDLDGEAYSTVSGQNSNNSIRVTDEFMEAVLNDGEWNLNAVNSSKVVKTIRARDLMMAVAEAAWQCADPGIQFHTTINDWNTVPKSGEIRASNPCSEYLGLDDSACNLSSINLTAFLNDDDSFDIDAFKHACRTMLLAQDIIIDYASYPTSKICENSHNLRALGLGYTNLGGLLMRLGVPYDSDQGRAIAAAITAIMTATAYTMSSRIAEHLEPFPHFKKNRSAMLKVIDKHRRAAYSINEKLFPENLENLFSASSEAWDEALEVGKRLGYRNSQVSLLAPTGTISFQMDAETTGVEPDFALVKFKKFAGGGTAKIVNSAVLHSLRRLGYTETQVKDMEIHLLGAGSLPFNGSEDGVTVTILKRFGFDETLISEINSSIKRSMSVDDAISFVPDAMRLIEEIEAQQGKKPSDSVGFSPLQRLGFNEEQISEVNLYSCGHMNLEQAPHLLEKHLAVFDCASKCGPTGTRHIQPQGHIKMLAAVQPMLSGSISKTINLPFEATVQDIWDIYVQAWQQGLKCVTIYRDGCKASQPLNAKGTELGKAEETKGIARKKMPYRRSGQTISAKINGYKMWIVLNRHPEDDRINEIFIETEDDGSVANGMLKKFALAVSMGLQYGVPMEKFIENFAGKGSFEPSGLTDHPQITTCRNPVDFIFRCIALEEGDDSYAQIKLPKREEHRGGVNPPKITLTKEMLPAKARVVLGRTCKCGSTRFMTTGTCETCMECGESTGCP